MPLQGVSKGDGSVLLIALTKLAALLAPVTAESLKACLDVDRHAVQSYWRWAIGLAVVIVPFSVASFVTSGFSDAIRKDIATANDLAVKISSGNFVLRLTRRPGLTHNRRLRCRRGLSTVQVIGELQQFASIIRSVDGRARRLNYFVLKLERDPYAGIRNNPDEVHATFQLPADLPNKLNEAFDGRIKVHQGCPIFCSEHSR